MKPSDTAAALAELDTARTELARVRRELVMSRANYAAREANQDLLVTQLERLSKAQDHLYHEVLKEDGTRTLTEAVQARLVELEHLKRKDSQEWLRGKLLHVARDAYHSGGIRALTGLRDDAPDADTVLSAIVEGALK